MVDPVLAGLAVLAIPVTLILAGVAYGKIRTLRGSPMDVHNPAARAQAWHSDRKTEDDDE